MKDWQQRVVDEMAELDARRAKLDAFMASGAFHELREVDRLLLEQQYGHMTAYSATLARRIAGFA